MTITPLIIDTDGGIDDAVALWWALTNPAVDVRAVTTVHGNVDLGRVVANIAIVLHAAGRADIPVGVGQAHPVGRAPDLLRASFIHGFDGLGDCGHGPDLPGEDIPAALGVTVTTANELLDRFAGDATIVTLGPLSTMAAALERHPSIASRSRRLVVMGGAFASPGNAYPAAEANIVHDPVAAQRVLKAAWNEPPLLVGLDVTPEATLTATEVALIAEHRNPAAAFCDGPLRTYARFGGAFCHEGEFPCHDLLATMAGALDDIVAGPILPVSVQTGPGPAWGMTVADFRQPFFERAGNSQAAPAGFVPCRVALELNHEAWQREVHRLFGG